MTRYSTPRAPIRYILLKGTIEGESDKAIKFRWTDADDMTVSMWFPLSQISSIVRSPNVEEDEVNVAQWILDKHNIPY